MEPERCYLCEEVNGRPAVFFKVDGARFYRCSHCGLVWLEVGRRPLNQAGYYSEQYYPEHYAGRKNVRDLFQYRFRLVRDFFKRGGKLLEIGAASGDFLQLLQDTGYEVYGVELSKRAAEQADRLYGLKLFQGTLEDAAFPPDFFDCVVLYHVLEHVPDPAGTLREIYRILKPGGRVLIEVPNVQSVDARFSKALLASILDYPNHLYAFTPALLKKMTEEAGFKTLIFERSFPFVVAQHLKKIRRFFGQRAQMKNPPSSQENAVLGTDLLRRASRESLLKRAVSRTFPGMKMSIVVEK